MSKSTQKQPPEISPYLLPIILAAMGLWCLYDGWFSANPDMQEHLMFNRVLSVILLSWAVFDFYKIRRALAAETNAAERSGKEENDTES
jgi:hypothetical protein